ncbi:mucin-5AC-like [Leptopilina heterotoma]|uniref:mucin-5AC-like n=1 Tax=Leptopilina heterotoma TaxID=63436 RepID=UPI001CA971DD|nr:mucin-5AC-like [Leptopilina heterotoma]
MIYAYFLLSTLAALVTCMVKSNYYNLKCETIGMSWESGLNDGCSFVCKKRNNNYKFNTHIFQKANNFTKMKTDDGFFCSNNGSCLDGSCIKLNNTSIHRLLEAFHPIVSKNMELNREKCQENGMSLAFEVSEGCIFVCEMKSDISNKRGYELKKIVYATDGSNCKTTGFCHEGMCINNNIKNPVTTTLTTTTTTTAINSSSTPTSTLSLTSTTTSTSAPTTLKEFKTESPNEKCKKLNMIFVENINYGCITSCKNETNKLEETLIAEDGYPCNNNNGLCSEGECINTVEGPVATIHKIITSPQTPTSTSIPPSTSSTNLPSTLNSSSTPTSTTTSIPPSTSGSPSTSSATLTSTQSSTSTPTSTSTSSTTSTSAPTTLKEFKTESPNEKCKKLNMIFVENINYGCITSCKNETNKLEETLIAEDGYPCNNNNGLCSEGECINTVEGPVATIHKIITSPQTPTSTSIPPSTSSTNLPSTLNSSSTPTSTTTSIPPSTSGSPSTSSATLTSTQSSTSTPTSTSTSSTTSTSAPTTLKEFKTESPNEKCKKLNMIFVENINYGCITSCKNETNKLEETLIAEDGYPCNNNNGLCSEGECINTVEGPVATIHKIITSPQTPTSTSIPPSTLSTNLPSTLTSTLSSSATTITTPALTTLNKLKPESSSEKCKKLNMILVENINYGCITSCKNETNKLEETLIAEDGYPCNNNNGLCSEGECINTIEGPVVTIYKIITTAQTLTSTSIPPSTSSSTSTSSTTSTSTQSSTSTPTSTSTSTTTSTPPPTISNKINPEYPSEKCKKISMSFVENFNEGCITTCINKTNNLEEYIVAENGEPCDYDGICDEGTCMYV